MLLTFLLLSHRKFKIKPLLIFGVRGKQNKAIVHISTKEVKKALTSMKIKYLYPFSQMP